MNDPSLFYDKNCRLIEAGMSLLWEYPNGSASCWPVIEVDGVLGIGSSPEDFTPLSNPIASESKICFTPEEGCIE